MIPSIIISHVPLNSGSKSEFLGAIKQYSEVVSAHPQAGPGSLVLTANPEL